ncbi:MAG: tyrosine--tRNA ligase [Nitriliruptoraceae bacterium]
MTTAPAVNALDVLRARGFVQDVTDEPGLRDAFALGPVIFYVGFDPTAASLHAGNLVGIMAMSWLQRLGHVPIALAGGATGRIGDPTGRDQERELLDDTLIEANLAGIRSQLAHVLDLDHEGGLVDNYTWTRPLTLLDFLRDVGVHASVNTMIAKDAVKTRLTAREQGLTFAELSYQLLQAYDFAVLYEQHGCVLQGGGSDQWGNIVAGIDLIRRRTGGSAYGLTWPLLTTADGTKFGKSAGNAVWLDAQMTSPYAYYQFWLNAADADVGRFLRLFTYRDEDEIVALEKQLRADPKARAAHRALARDATAIIHGDDAVEQAERASAVLFGGQGNTADSDGGLADVLAAAPSAMFDRTVLDGGLGVLAALTTLGATKSNGEARRLVAQGALRVNDVPIDDPAQLLTSDDLSDGDVIVFRLGKRRYFVARFT